MHIDVLYPIVLIRVLWERNSTLAVREDDDDMGPDQLMSPPREKLSVDIAKVQLYRLFGR